MSEDSSLRQDERECNILPIIPTVSSDILLRLMADYCDGDCWQVTGKVETRPGHDIT